MINGLDTMILVRLAADRTPWTFRSLGKELNLDPAALHRSVARLKEAGLLNEDRDVNRAAVEEYLIHAVRYISPAKRGSLERGMPTAWAIEPLRGLVADAGEPPPVWPDPHGDVRGQAVQPIADEIISLSKARPDLQEWFALIDGIRIGRARERQLATRELKKLLRADPASSS